MDEVHYLLGNSCDLKCDFCFWNMRLPDISLSRKKLIIDKIKEVEIRKVTISGGEPTYSRDFLEVIDYCYGKGLEVFLHTHGLRIDEKVANKLSRSVSRVSLTLDGSNEKVIYKMRKNRKIFRHTLFLIDLLDSLGVGVSVKTLVTKINKEDIVNIGKVLLGKPVQYWSLLEFNPLNRGQIYKDRFLLTNNDFDAIAAGMKRTFPKIQIEVRRFRRELRHYCFIASNGLVYTFVPGRGDILAGDVFKSSLESIIKNIHSLTNS